MVADVRTQTGSPAAPSSPSQAACDLPALACWQKVLTGETP